MRKHKIKSHAIIYITRDKIRSDPIRLDEMIKRKMRLYMMI